VVEVKEVRTEVEEALETVSFNCGRRLGEEILLVEGSDRFCRRAGTANSGAYWEDW
jgi:hypothetical protein